MGFITKRHTWNDVAQKIEALNPVFAQIVNKISPDDKHCFYEMEYTYGDDILQNNSEFFMPCDGELISINDSRAPKQVYKDLSYNFQSNPVGIILQGAFELFITFDDRIAPFAVIPPGAVFGLWRILDQETTFAPREFPWGMTCGVRSLFMLSKISEHGKHKKLMAEFSLNMEAPKLMSDHHQIFKAITNRHGKPWKTKILFFSKHWFEHFDDPTWMEFNYHLLRKNWVGSGYWRNQFIWNIIYSSIQKEKSVKPDLYIGDIARHVISIATGVCPGFQPALDDAFAPISTIKQAYDDIYKLKYASTIMQPAYFKMGQTERPVYYSLQYPTSFETHIKSNIRNTTLHDTYEVYSLLMKLVNGLAISDLEIDQHIPLNHLGDKVEFKAFHAHSMKTDLLNLSNIILEEDKSFFDKNHPNKTILKSFSFFNGCIRIKNQPPTK